MLTSPKLASATPAAKDATCLPCEIPVFCRNHYYRGKLLTERDFAAEQQYHSDRMRLHTLALHGWGVVCGFEVRPHPYCPDQRIVVGEGFAIDCCGREIRILQPVDLTLPPPPPPPPPRPPRAPPPPPHAPTAASAAAAPGSASEAEANHGGPPHEPRPDEPDHHHRPPDEDCEPEPVPRDLYLCIVHTECETEFSPAPFDDCACTNGSVLQPNRICEGFRLELYEERPEHWERAVERRCEANDCRELYGDGCEPCREPHPCCVPLAVIVDFVPGRKILAEQIRIRGHRRELRSTETLDDVLRCVLDKLPAGDLTRIDDINWEHDGRYLCREFISDFVSSHEHARGFRIRFTDRVRSRTIDSRSFQIYVIYRHEDPALPRQIEYVPIDDIHKEEDETDWCRLSISREYAIQRLDGRDFDLFVVLRCDVITDLHGVAVDGNFLGGSLPTGDRVPGGTFESWIQVRSRRADRL
jgi:hypothetical protein